MKNRNVLKVISMIIGFSMMTMITQAETQTSSGTNDLAIGERIWPPVSNGVIFISGKYLPPPYIISRREGTAFVNGIYLAFMFPWPPKKQNDTIIPKEKPLIPNSISEKTTVYDKDYIEYIYYVRQYLIAKYPKHKVVEMMADVYRQLPCVRDVKFDSDDDNYIIVTWVTGEKRRDNQFPVSVRHKDNNMTKEQMRKIIDKVTETYVKGLENNYYYLEGAGGGRMGTFEGFKGTFKPLVAALHAAKDEDEFLFIVKTNNPPQGLSEEWFRMFYRDKDNLTKWEWKLWELK